MRPVPESFMTRESHGDFVGCRTVVSFVLFAILGSAWAPLAIADGNGVQYGYPSLEGGRLCPYVKVTVDGTEIVLAPCIVLP